MWPARVTGCRREAAAFNCAFVDFELTAEPFLLDFEPVREILNCTRVRSSKRVRLPVLSSHSTSSASSCNFAWLYCELMVAIAAFCVIVSLSRRTFRFSCISLRSFDLKLGIDGLLFELRI